MNEEQDPDASSNDETETLSETLTLDPSSRDGAVGGRYELRERLGGGGFGEVYRAYDRVLDRVVALKTVFSQQLGGGGSQALDQALAEARTFARLDHQHIVPVFDAGREGDQIWMAMRRVEGPTLAAVLQGGGPLPRERALRLLRQVAEALDHAHRRAIVHRDVKPSNILLDEQDRERAFLTDFGIAKALSGPTTELDTAVVGTPAYMAPEQITGKRVDARTDVFALGCVAIESLSGRRALAGGSMSAVAYQIVHEPPGGLSEVAANAGEDCSAALRQWLRKSPEDRRQSMAEVFRDLDRLTTRRLGAADSTPHLVAHRPGAVGGQAALGHPHPLQPLPPCS